MLYWCFKVMLSNKVFGVLLKTTSNQVSRRFVCKIYPNILSCIGNTPIVRLDKIAKEEGLECELLAKCEYLNPGGSHKDRAALLEIERAEASGKIGPDTIIVSSTTGNAGISLGMVCAIKGYKCVLLMPDKMRQEKVNIMDALGVHCVRAASVTDESSPVSYQNVARRLAAQMTNAFLLDQYTTRDNPEAHYMSTASEILEACDGELDAVVIGTGSGGTMSGVGKRLKEHNPKIKVIAVHTQGSTMDQIKPSDSHEKIIEGGLGHTFSPDVLDRSVVDRWIKIDNQLMFLTARRLQSHEGILCGASAGAVVAAAIQVGQGFGQGHRVVTIISDGVRNYLHQFLSEEWLKSQGWSVQHFTETLLPDKPIDNWEWPNVVYIDEDATLDEAVEKFRLLHNPSDYLLILDKGGFVTGAIARLHLKHRAGLHKHIKELTIAKYATLSNDASIRYVGRKLKVDPVVLVQKKGFAPTKKPHFKQVQTAISSVNLVTTIFSDSES